MVDGIRNVVREVAAALFAHIDTLALYEGTVVSQADDGSLDVRLDDDRFGPGWSQITIAWGLPGLTAKVSKGTRVAVGFHGGKRSKPVVRHWLSEATEKPIEILLETTAKVELKAPSVVLAEGVLGVARQTDPVVCGPFAGTITAGSTKVKAG